MPLLQLLTGVIVSGKLGQIFLIRLLSKNIQEKFQQIMITFKQMKALNKNYLQIIRMNN